MTLDELEVMIHVYGTSAPIDDRQLDAAYTLVGNGMIVKDESRKSGYSTTERGDVYVGFLLETPLPVQTWSRP